MTQPRSVLVTGASSGIGRATVAALLAEDYQVWAAVRRPSDAEELIKEFGDRLRSVTIDLLDDASVRAAAAEVRTAGPLYGLVNCAGVALPGPLELLPIDVFRRQLEINLVGQLLLTQCLLPALHDGVATWGRARVIMVGSLAGRFAVPLLGAYSTSKHGLAGLSDVLRAELAPSKIKLVLLEPGIYATPIWRRGVASLTALRGRFGPGIERYASLIRLGERIAPAFSDTGQPADQVARVVSRSLNGRFPSPRRAVGVDARLTAALTRVTPIRLLNAGRSAFVAVVTSRDRDDHSGPGH